MSARAVRMVLAALVAVLLLGGCKFDGAYDLPLPGHPVSKDHSFTITADFADVLDVVPRSTVMVDDVVVGEVTDVERVGWHARVTMRVKNDVRLPANADADIRQVSLLGEKYIALVPPVSGRPHGRLADGAHIPLSATGRNPEVEEVLGALSFLLTGGGVAQLGTITKEANKVMDGREDRLRGVLRSLEGVVATIDGQKDAIVGAMKSLNSLASTLNGEKDVIGDALDATGPAVKVLAGQHDQLIGMLSSLQRLGKVGTRVIRGSKDNVLKILQQVDPILNRIADAGTKLAPGLNLLASFPFPKAANAIVQGDYADTIARVQIDLSNIYQGLNLPDIQLGDGTPLDPVLACLQSGNLLSSSCTTVLGTASLLKTLKSRCRTQTGNPVCRLLNSAPSLNLNNLLGVSYLGGGTGGVEGLARSIVDPTPDRAGSVDQLYGGGV